ncbi:MAG: hypothetical protein H6810_04080 [Phycisphaeraceae bacterium]|nr:MAG: hypothetical protein H6810_04080 [Phycisphaeraceae bacterium]
MKNPALIVAGAMSCSFAHGQLILTADNRTTIVEVEIELTDPDDGVTQHFFDDLDTQTPATPYADFQAVVSAHAQDIPANYGSSLASQISTADAFTLGGQGTAYAEGGLAFAVPPSLLTSNATSDYRISFDVEVPTLVRVQADLHCDSPDPGSGTFALSRARLKKIVNGVPVEPVILVAVLNSGVEHVDQTVLLLPGRYEQELTADASLATLNGTPGPASASFSGVLTVLGSPCNAADIAEPFGVLDLADIQAFVSAFVNAEPAADIAEPFGVWDLFDVQVFITQFAIVGCP